MFKNFMFVGVVVAVLAGTAGCGKVTKRCLPSNCSGCCNNDDACVQSATRVTCGLNGVACVVCGGSDQCVAGACSSGSADGGTGGGAGGGTANGGGVGTTGGGRNGGGSGVNGGGTGTTGGGTGSNGGGTGANGGGFAPGSGIVINEVDYDNRQTDNAEFVELLNTGTGTESLAGVSLVLVNGANNLAYNTIALDTYNSLGPGEYFVIGSAPVISALPSGVRSAPWGTSMTTDNLQNGAPDAVALVRNGVILDSLSYEGSTLWDAGAPIGRVNLTEGMGSTLTLADDNTDAGTISRLPNGADTNQNAVDFAFTPNITPGLPNQ